MDIGEKRETIRIEPMPEPVPVQEPAPEPVQVPAEPEKVPV